MCLFASILSVFLVLLSLHYAKKMCKKDRSFLCAGYVCIEPQQTAFSPLPPVSIAQQGRHAEYARTGLGADIFHPPSCFLPAL